MIKCVSIIGAPAVGKSSLLKSVLNELDGEPEYIEPLKLFRCTKYNDILCLGQYNENEFSGTDSWSYSVLAKGKFENYKTKFDMIWCCEFVEHVEKQYEDNWMSLMQSAKYVFVTYSEPGKPGHHHVNCEDKHYWLELFKKYGFTYRDDYTFSSKARSTMEREFWRSRGLVFENVKSDQS